METTLVKQVEEEYSHEEIQEMLLELQYSLQDAAPGNPVVENFFRLGKLHLTNACPTAGVTVDKEGNVFLIFSPKFVKEIMKYKNHKQMLEFVLMHEAMHVILEHIKRRRHRNPYIWNIACDAIVNTTIWNIFSNRFYTEPNKRQMSIDIKKRDEKGNVIPLFSIPIEKNSHFIIEKNNNINTEFVNEMNDFFSSLIHPSSVEETAESCYILCAEELYEKLMRNVKQVTMKGLGTLDDHSGWEKSEDEKDGKGKDGKSGDGKDGKEEKTRAQEMAEEQLKEVLKDALAKTVQGNSDCTSKLAGKTPCGEFREIGFNIIPKRLPWDKMLKNFIASRIDEYVEECWHNPSRKLRQFYPTVVLPNEFEVEDRQKLLVQICIDTSGSMDGETLKKVQGVLSCFPADKVDYAALSFDTQIYQIDTDITKCSRFRGGGGTSFQEVANYVHNLPMTPDVVIMITDGYDSPPKLQAPNTWLWLLVPGGHNPGGRIGTVLPIS